jgi:type 2 lantibiotic biosynthesis protein LanM
MVSYAEIFKSPDWLRSMTLAERLRLMPQFPTDDTTDQSVNSSAERVLYRWQADPPFNNESVFASRLHSLDLTPTEFGALLSTPVEMFVSEYLPWLAKFAEAFSTPVPSAAEAMPLGFLRAVEPLLARWRTRFCNGVNRIIRSSERVLFDPDSVDHLFSVGLLRRLTWMLSRAMALELNVARLSGQLDGDSSESRFLHFVQSLERRDTAIALLREYPVLSRQLIICLDQWLAFGLEFLSHLSRDFERIKAVFGLDTDPGLLTEIVSDAGDRHRNGRSVTIAKFSSGFTLVYKPRSLAIDIHFNDLLAWTNEKGFRPLFRKLQILDRGSHGWEEYAQARDCQSVQEIHNFYRRQGGYLAILYALGATDFHHENVVAAGEYPILLDLEALFTPTLESHSVQQFGVEALVNSVLSTGLLPLGTAEKFDFSGLGDVNGRLSPTAVLHPEHAATDEMRYVRTPLPMRGRTNRPTLAGTSINLLDHVESMKDAFHDMYDLLIRNRECLLGVNGLLATFTEDQVRVVIRPTQTYSRLLEDSFHPDVLRDAIDRDHLLDQLWSWVAHYQELSRVISAEQKALLRCDIPLFTTRPISRDISTCSGQIITGLLKESGLSRSQQRIRELNQHHLNQQIWLIQTSVATQAVGKRVPQRLKKTPEKPSLGVRDDLVCAATAIGNRLEELAVRRNGRATWISLATKGRNEWSIVPVGADLYDGLSGIALFLAYLGWITGVERFTSLAVESAMSLQDSVKSERPSMRGIGGFAGLGGIIYELAHMGALWDDTALISRALELTNLLPDLISKDGQFDIVGGAAGCLLSLLALGHVSSSRLPFDLANKCGEVLIASAIKQESGSAWPNDKFEGRSLVGFSHGTAGMAYALTELSRKISSEQCFALAFDAMQYERSLFDAERGSWPDLRNGRHANSAPDTLAQSDPVAWCHGAPGIGLSRLKMLWCFHDSQIQNEIETAVSSTIAWGLGDNHSLCHGALGNLEFLHQAAECLERSDLTTYANDMKLNILESIATEGWKCGPPLSTDTPGLMTGLAGIGYELLRLTEPNRVPSVLLLEPFLDH